MTLGCSIRLSLLALAALTALAAPSAAESDRAFQRDVLFIQESVQALAAQAAQTRAQGPTCPEAKELERNYAVIVPIAHQGGIGEETMGFIYAACREIGMNGVEAPKTERTFTGPDGYVLVIATYEDMLRSEIELLRNGLSEGRFDATNQSLASGARVNLGRGYAVRGLEPRPVERFPQLAACEAQTQTLRGQSAGLRLMLLTERTAYYYYEDCDICAALDACDLKTAQLRTVKTAHALSCEDVAPYKSGPILYSCK